MKKLLMMGILALALGACAARPALQATPAQRAQAVAVLVYGGDLHDVATELAVGDADARRIVRATVKDLMRELQRPSTARRGGRSGPPQPVPRPRCAAGGDPRATGEQVGSR